MTEWNTNIDEAPAGGKLLVTTKAGNVVLTALEPGVRLHIGVAWMPVPEPYQEPCPEQVVCPERAGLVKEEQVMEYDEGQGKTYGAKRGTSPAPKLPEGYHTYTATKLGSAICLHSSSFGLVATIDQEGVDVSPWLPSEQWLALAAFLQGAR